MRAVGAAAERRGNAELQLVAGALDRETEPAAQDDPAIGRKGEGDRIGDARPRFRGEAIEFRLEAACEIGMVGGIELRDHVRRRGRPALQRLDEGPHRQQPLEALRRAVDDDLDAGIHRRSQRRFGHLAELGGEDTFEDRHVELRRVSKMLEHGPCRYTGHLGDIAHDRRHLAGGGERRRRGDDGLTGTRDPAAAGGQMRHRLPFQYFDFHSYPQPGDRRGEAALLKQGPAPRFPVSTATDAADTNASANTTRRHTNMCRAQ